MRKSIIAFLFISIAFFQASKLSAQCPGCIINQANCSGVADGEVCADTLPTATIQANYEEEVTFFFPRRFTVQAGGTLPGGIPFPALPGFPSVVIMNVLRVNLLSITGLPPGLSWECDSSHNNCQYIPDFSQQHGCVKICGAVNCDSSGSYTVSFNFEYVINGQDFLDAFTMGTPFPFPIPLELPSTASYTVNMQVNPILPNQLAITANKPTVISQGENISLFATTGFASYLWSTGATTDAITISPTGSTLYSLQVSDSAGCTKQASFGVTVLIANNIQDAVGENFLMLYPNPNNGEFYVRIENVKDVVQFELFDIQGRKIHQEMVSNVSGTFNKKLSLKTLDEGVYYLQLKSQDFSVVKKVTVHK